MTERPADAADTPAETAPRGSAVEVFVAFLALGLSAFGGPVAHLGYFRSEFVERRRWLGDDRYADLVALCQFLPGPASSQVGMALGLGRAGWRGAIAAWTGFTLPSALALGLLAAGVGGASATGGALHGLKLAAVAVVAQAVRAMAISLCPDRPRAAIAIGAALIALVAPTSLGQIAALVLGAGAGLALLRGLHTEAKAPTAPGSTGVGKPLAIVALVAFFGLLLALPIAAAATGSPWLALTAAFYRAGALVFGGGHVVLPLLQAAVVDRGWIGGDAFLAGYGAAQAVPGPLFSFAAYLGAAMPAPLGRWAGAAVALVALFAPGALVLVGALPFWETLRHRPALRRAMAGCNAAVVGMLGAALYDPVATGALHSRSDAALALAAFGLLVLGRVSPVLVVGAAAIAGFALGR